MAFSYALHHRGFYQIKISKIDDSMWYKLPKATGLVGRHFTNTILNHSIMRLIRKTERQSFKADGWSKESSVRSEMRSAAWQLHLEKASEGHSLTSQHGASRELPHLHPGEFPDNLDL